MNNTKYSKVIFILIVTFLNIESSFSQVSEKWVARFNGTANSFDGVNSMKIDGLGNIYLTGYSIFSGTNVDYATIKYNSNGVQQWVARYNGLGNSDDRASSIALDNSGNVYVTGTSIGTGTGFEYATIKYNSAGVQQWISLYTGPGNSLVQPASIAVDNSGNLYMSGTSNGSYINCDYVTVKYNSNGFQQWVSLYNGPANLNDFAKSIAIDNSGNVYVSGESIDSIESSHYATIKYNYSGNLQWAASYDGPGNLYNNNDEVSSMILDTQGNVYVTGRSYGSGLYPDYATLKYNSSGIQQWVARYSGPGISEDFAKSIAVDNSGDVYVTGYSVNSYYDYATVKYNSAGIEQWVKRYDGPVHSTDKAYAVATDNFGNVYVTGESYNTGAGLDYATIKYNSSGAEQWIKRYDGPNVNSNETAISVALDGSGNVYVTGESGSDIATIKYSQIKKLHLTAFLEGFYNPYSNLMTPDTVTVYLRNTSAPFNLIDSAKGILNSSGTGDFNFKVAVNATNYYLIIKHRNSIETWSNTGYSFTSDSLSFDFSTAANMSYGNNQILTDNFPLRYAFYSGDVTQDGIIDASDISAVENDASNSLSGYVNTDVSGDYLVDAADISIVENNTGVNSITQ